MSLTVLDGPCFLYPVCQVSNKVKEEVILWDADDLGMQPSQLWAIWFGSDFLTDILVERLHPQPEGFCVLVLPTPLVPP